MSRTGFGEPGGTIHRGCRSISHRLLAACGRETRDGIASMAGVAVTGKRNGRTVCRGARSLTEGKTGCTGGVKAARFRMASRRLHGPVATYTGNLWSANQVKTACALVYPIPISHGPSVISAAAYLRFTRCIVFGSSKTITQPVRRGGLVFADCALRNSRRNEPRPEFSRVDLDCASGLHSARFGPHRRDCRFGCDDTTPCPRVESDSDVDHRTVFGLDLLFDPAEESVHLLSATHTFHARSERQGLREVGLGPD